VDNEDAYGVQLDGLTTRTWSVFAEDRLSLARDRFVVTAGVRRDEHDAFGASTNPRVALSWKASSVLRLRAAAGSAFRAPATGELYYPFSGTRRSSRSAPSRTRRGRSGPSAAAPPSRRPSSGAT
jgi:Outer membrane receptor for ferrienterochelin and colicins